MAAELETTRKEVVDLNRQLEEKSKDLGRAESDLELTRRTSEVRLVRSRFKLTDTCKLQFQFQFISLIELEHQGWNSCTDMCPIKQ